MCRGTEEYSSRRDEESRDHKPSVRFLLAFNFVPGGLGDTYQSLVIYRVTLYQLKAAPSVQSASPTVGHCLEVTVAAIVRRLLALTSGVVAFGFMAFPCPRCKNEYDRLE